MPEAQIAITELQTAQRKIRQRLVDMEIKLAQLTAATEAKLTQISDTAVEISQELAMIKISVRES